MGKREIFVLLLTTVLLVGPVFWQARNLTFRLNTDYDTVLPIFHYVVRSVREGRGFPLRNPYIGTGVSVIGEPLSAILNPLLAVPILALGVEQGLRLTFALVVFASGVSMWVFLMTLGVNGPARLWGAVLYQTSGALSGRMPPGQIETVLAYPLIPLFFSTLVVPVMKRRQLLNASLAAALVVFSGDFYTLWFLSIFFAVTKIYYLVTRQQTLMRAAMESFVVFVLFLIFSSVKLVPFLFEVLPNIERFRIINPYLGSIHAFLSFLPFMVPYRIGFYDRPIFRWIFGFHYNWYEYYAFISMLPLLFLIKIKSVVSQKYTMLLLVLLGIGVLYSALKYPYSPFYWLFHWVPAFGTFRVPQRIFTPMTTILIGLLAICAERWLHTKKSLGEKNIIIGIFILSVIWVGTVGWQTLLMSFEPPRTAEAHLVRTLREKDQGVFFVAAFSCCMQTFLVSEGIPILNYYYGWRLKGMPNFTAADGEQSDFSELRTMRPTYIIAPKAMDFALYSYRQFIEEGNNMVWKTETPNIFPTL